MVKVTAVKALEGHRLELTFDTGELRMFDVGPYLQRGIFTELKDENYFRQVRLAFRSIAWPNEQDFSAEKLYADSMPAAREVDRAIESRR